MACFSFIWNIFVVYLEVVVFLFIGRNFAVEFVVRKVDVVSFFIYVGVVFVFRVGVVFGGVGVVVVRIVFKEDSVYS